MFTKSVFYDGTIDSHLIVSFNIAVMSYVEMVALKKEQAMLTLIVLRVTQSNSYKKLVEDNGC